MVDILAKYCTNCGSRIRENTNFCLNCGAEINTENQSINKEEVKKIGHINNLLEQYERLIQFIGDKSLYSRIILSGQRITEEMVILYLDKEGHKIERKTFGQIIKICETKKILPETCLNFLKIMLKYRNISAHSPEPTYDMTKTYLETFNYFLLWFNEFYSQKYYIKKPFKIERISLLINSISSDDVENLKVLDEEYDELNKHINKIMKEYMGKKENLGNINKSIGQTDKDKIKRMRLLYPIRKSKYSEKQFKQKKEELTKELKELQSQQTEINNLKILRILENLSQKINELNQKIDELSDTAERIEKKIDTILYEIDNKMSSLQSFISKQINNSNSYDIDKIIENFTKEYVENISTEYYTKISKEYEYEKQKKKLIYSLGKDAWYKLSETSQTFLITSKVMYDDLLMIDEISDYSGICILVTKALEEEMFKRFFINFINYCKEKFGQDYSKYHTALLFKGKDILLEDKFTMGNIAFILCYTENRYDSEKQIKNNENILLNYCKDNIFSNRTDKEIKHLLYEYAENIEKIRIDYRNPSAHRNKIKRINAEECFDLVLDVEKLLKKMLDSFDV